MADKQLGFHNYKRGGLTRGSTYYYRNGTEFVGHHKAAREEQENKLQTKKVQAIGRGFS
ncbi:hypothetical protein SO802_019404 [Lithocarpus litseifolius]|uniref:Uncharacterized protein n=1 Tax=Lithocarpus litseifolius TaxID=425828 RepID=A0AAW2CP16_9ROSI